MTSLRIPRWGMVLWLLVVGLNGHSQAGASERDSTGKFRVFGLPILYFTPETKLAFGAGGIATWKFPGDSATAKVSSLYAGALYTQLKQVLTYSVFNFWPRNGKYNFWGEIAYYHYNFYLYGVGESPNPLGRELYGLDFPRVRIHAQERVRGNWYLGLRYNLEPTRVYDLESGGLLASGVVPGWNGGLSSGPGLVLKLDSRDNLFYPKKGVYLEAYTQHEGKYTGSDFRFSRLSLDYASYYTKGRHTLALNGYISLTQGTSPFFQMSFLGGPRRLRGIYEGKYRDQNALLAQAEYRFWLGWRLGLNVFGGIGTVGGKPLDLTRTSPHPAYGLGLRFQFDKAQHINVRLDAGRDRGETNFYLTISEAF